MPKLKLAVIGEPCMDYIYRGTGSTEKQFGGILYSAVSLAVISSGKADVYPVMNLGEDEFSSVSGFLAKFPNLKQGHIFSTPHKTRIVNLFYKDKASVLNVSAKKTYDREENSTEPTLPVKLEQIKGLLKDLNGILINLVSGVDLELDTMLMIRDNFNGYIHMDLHNLVMQTFPDGTRKQMPVDNWQQWVNSCDTLQMNESEMAIFTGENVTEYETAEKILAGGNVKCLVVTRGRAGVTMYTRKTEIDGSDNYYDLHRLDVPSIDSPKFVDSTGCGDVFASSFFYKNVELKCKDFTEALNFANNMASLNASLHGVEDLRGLSL
ncbi:MAG: carbohydrate kinase family protein [Ignavibacteria bacterium]|nr:carbohydrate kinase family protein [Ignavibacteria bacterium]